MRPAPGLWLVSPGRRRVYGKIAEIATQEIVWRNQNGHRISTKNSTIERGDYDCVIGPIDGSPPPGYAYGGPTTMKLKKPNPGNGICDAMRCKQAPIEVHQLPDGTVVELCAKHSAEARQDPNWVAEVYPIPPAAQDGETWTEGTALVKVEGTVDALSELEQSPFVQELLTAAAEHEESLALIRQFEIQHQDGFTFIEGIVQEAKAKLKEIEERRTKFTKPANALLRRFNSWFKPVKSALEGIESTGKLKLSAYRAYQAQQQQELVRQAQAQAQAQAPAIQIQTTLVAASNAMPETSSTSYIDRWRFCVEDASALPREYWKPDLEAIGAIVKVKGGETQIPGVKVWNDPIVRSSSK